MSKVRLSLSHQSRVASYLDASSFDFLALQSEVAQARTTLTSLHNKQELARAEHDRASAVIEADKAEKLASFDAASDGFLRKYCKLRMPENMWVGTFDGIDPSKPNFDPDRLAAKQRFEEAQAAYKAVEHNSVYPYQVNSIKGEITSAERHIDALIQKIRNAEESVKNTRAKLPAAACILTLDQMRAFCSFSVPEETDCWNPDAPFSEVLGIVRGELPLVCDRCHEGHEIVDISDEVSVVLDDEVRHPVCHARAQWNPAVLDGLIPASHVGHRVHSLKPWARSPVPMDRQESIHRNLPSDPENVRGWLMSGPAGSSKTTYAAASIIDMLTTRVVHNDIQCGDLNYWRIKIPKWLREMEEWETRDFHDDRVSPPSIQPYQIEMETARIGLPPILWLEELDKFAPTKNRLKNLYSLIDAVYESNGTIIATTNEKLPELRLLLGDPVYRRLTGDNDDASKFWKLDLYAKAAKKTVTSALAQQVPFG